MIRDIQGKQRDSSGEKRDVTSVTPSRAHAPSGSVTLSRRDNKRDDRDSTTLRFDAVTVTKSRGIWKTDKRFAGWLAGASAEQQARWERMQSGLAADPVKDEQLPPALRGGALEAF